MKKEISQKLKDEIVGKSAKMRDKNDTVIEGIIIGRLAEFPVFRTLDGLITIELSWNLAYRAVFENVYIIG